jgi:hypothetical protein
VAGQARGGTSYPMNSKTNVSTYSLFHLLFKDNAQTKKVNRTATEEKRI